MGKSCCEKTKNEINSCCKDKENSSEGNKEEKNLGIFKVRNILIIIGVLLLIALLIFSLIPRNNSTGKSISSSDSSLDIYRLKNIPEECRLPDYETNLDSWKEHLGHHKPTWYCLEDYYGVILNG